MYSCIEAHIPRTRTHTHTGRREKRRKRASTRDSISIGNNKQQRQGREEQRECVIAKPAGDAEIVTTAQHLRTTALVELRDAHGQQTARRELLNEGLSGTEQSATQRPRQSALNPYKTVAATQRPRINALVELRDAHGHGSQKAMLLKSVAHPLDAHMIVEQQPSRARRSRRLVGQRAGTRELRALGVVLSRSTASRVAAELRGRVTRSGGN